MEILERIVGDLEYKFALECEIEGNCILINEFDGYIKGYNTYRKMEELAIAVCRNISQYYGDEIRDIDYEIVGQDGENDLRFEVIL